MDLNIHKNDILIQAKSLSVGYKSPGSTACICSNIHTELRAGELCALIGRNGQGKSTIIRTLVGLQPKLGGEYLILGNKCHKYSIKERARLISYVATDTVKVGHLKVRDLVEMGRYPYTNWMGGLTQTDRIKVDHALELVGMTRFQNNFVAKLSDGERQRVMIARCIAQDTPIIILDEPTAFLDLPNKYELVLLLKNLAHEENKCILFSTHDMSTAFQIVDRIWVVHDCNLTHGDLSEVYQAGAISDMLRGTDLYYDPESRVFRHPSGIG